MEADQCQFGLRVRAEEALNKKPTRFMVNSEAIANKLRRRCNGEHPHQPLTNGRAKAAEEYPPALCKAIVQGAQEHMKSQLVLVEDDQDQEEDIEDALDREMEDENEPGRVGRMKPAVEDEEEDEQEQAPKQLGCAVTPQEKRLIYKLHQNLGHPQRSSGLGTNKCWWTVLRSVLEIALLCTSS